MHYNNSGYAIFRGPVRHGGRRRCRQPKQISLQEPSGGTREERPTRIKYQLHISQFAGAWTCHKSAAPMPSTIASISAQPRGPRRACRSAAKSRSPSNQGTPALHRPEPAGCKSRSCVCPITRGPGKCAPICQAGVRIRITASEIMVRRFARTLPASGKAISGRPLVFMVHEHPESRRKPNTIRKIAGVRRIQSAAPTAG